MIMEIALVKVATVKDGIAVCIGHDFLEVGHISSLVEQEGANFCSAGVALSFSVMIKGVLHRRRYDSPYCWLRMNPMRWRYCQSTRLEAGTDARNQYINAIASAVCCSVRSCAERRG